MTFESIISGLCIYPIKGMAGISLKRAIVANTGLTYDRVFGLVDEEGKIITQRQNPMLCLFKQEIINGMLRVSYLKDHIDIPLNFQSDEEVSIQVWDDEFDAMRLPLSFSNWFSSRLHMSCYVVRYNDETPRERERNKMYFETAMSDGYPILICGEESVEALNKQLESPVEMNRFRPNIVVKGLDAFAELEFDQIICHDQTSVLSKVCERCMVTTIDQQTGKKSGKEPLQTLVKLGNGKAVFGRNFVLPEGLEIQIGDKITWHYSC